MTFKHKQVKIEYGRLEAQVDEDLADLILDFWKLDVNTLLSCQDNVPAGFVWINFDSAADAEEFLNCFYYEEKYDSVYQSIRENNHDDNKNWIYSTHVEDLGIEQTVVNEGTEDEDGVEKFIGENCFLFNISIRFPREHLEFVKQKVKEQVERHEQRTKRNN